MASLLFTGVIGAPVHIPPGVASELSLCASNVVVPPVISVPENSSIRIDPSDEQFPVLPVNVTVSLTGEVFGVIAPKVEMKSLNLLGPTSPLMGVKVQPGAVSDKVLMAGVR